jgi:N-carbamoyl-L-amino-acid hydrolase
MTARTADGARVLADLNALRAIGAFKTGVHKPSLSQAHIDSLDWFARRCGEAGLTAGIDGIGNLIGSDPAPGRKLLAGSHLESQNEAGWLDGPLGCVYALEAARVLNGDPALRGGGVDVACWFDEEGHFGHFLGSRSFVGQVTDAIVAAAIDRTDGRTLPDALAKAGYAGRPRVQATARRHIGYLEAHIEQGESLESAGLAIGVVTSIVGIWQFKIVIEGTQNHAGTTRMAIRRDAGLAAVKLLDDLDGAFRKAAGPRTVWTTGRITLDPGAPSIIPGRAEVWFQIRDDDLDLLHRLEALLRERAAAHDRAGPCRIAVERLRMSTPAHMHAGFQGAIEAAAKAHAGGRSVRMPSGAGHDAQVLSEIMPAAMLFVPSIGGISHHWTENTSDADIATGATVFVEACRRILTDAVNR